MTRAPSLRRLPLALALAVAGAAGDARAQSADNVLLVVNDRSAASRDVGEYYAAARRLPETQVVRISVEARDEVTPAEFAQQIERPIAQWFEQSGAYDRILYIVLTKGVPLRVQGTGGRDATTASVDSELTLLYRKLVGVQVPAAGRVANPYFAGEAPIAGLRPFSHAQHDIYLVTRLDGFTVADVKGLIDRGGRAATTGAIVLDRRPSSADLGDRWLTTAAERLQAGGTAALRVLAGAEEPADAGEVLGYYSWGSNDPALRQRRPGVSFAPGALAAMFVSSDARTFTEPAEGWTVGGWEDRRAYFAGAPASLTADLIRHGVTGVAGTVADPFLEGAIRPQILFPAYVAGRNLVESFYAAMPFLSWQTVVVGDPLAGSFDGPRLGDDERQPPPAPVTELPLYFSERRLGLMARTGMRREALELYLRAAARLRAGDAAAARIALEQATALDDRLAPAHALLASLHEASRDYESAMERYRRILAVEPDDAVALNNLAYALAVHMNQPADALPLAQRAFAVASANASVADTLGWIHHLLGDRAAAARFIAIARLRAPDSAEICLHSAIVLAATGQPDAAAAELARAVVLDARLGARDDVAQVRATLAAARPR